MAVTKNEAGFSGRQWESDVTGQQYPTKREALRDEAAYTRDREDLLAALAALDPAVRCDDPFHSHHSLEDARACVRVAVR
jgi:hypothetical protein